MRIHRPTLTIGVAIMVLLGNTMPAQDVALERVWPSYRDAASFTRLLEYFGGAPDATNRDAIRSQPEKRAGYYWLVRSSSPQSVADCTIKLEIHRHDQTGVQVHTFPYSIMAGSHAINVGLTGSDWADPAARPIAWQLTLLAPNGSPLVSERSFLWQRQP